MNTRQTTLYGQSTAGIYRDWEIMPIYQCFSREGLLDESARGKVAEEITRIHCDATGIPPSFVNVLFVDLPDGRYFVAGKPSAHSFLNGAIRFGRDRDAAADTPGSVADVDTSYRPAGGGASGPRPGTAIAG